MRATSGATVATAGDALAELVTSAGVAAVAAATDATAEAGAASGAAGVALVDPAADDASPSDAGAAAGSPCVVTASGAASADVCWA